MLDCFLCDRPIEEQNQVRIAKDCVVCESCAYHMGMMVYRDANNFLRTSRGNERV